MIHTIGDIVLAANIGRELHLLVIDYLRDYCTYANGANNIEYVAKNIKFTTIHGIAGTPEHPILKVSVCTKDESVPFDAFIEETPPDGYEGYGRYGRHEVSYYRDSAYSVIDLPMALLLDSKEVRVDKLTKIQQNWITKKEDEAKQRKIKRLKDELAELGA